MMNRSHPKSFHAFYVFALAGLAALALPCLVFAQSISDLKSPEDIAKFRQAYIDDFQRIGLNSTPGDARLLRILIQAAGCKRGIEVGTATGYGAIVMGMAFEANQGVLITLDIDPKMVKTAQEHIKNVGMEKTIVVIEGDALKTLPELQGEFDFIYIDALKQDYLRYFKAVESKMKPGSVIVADNVIKFESAMKDFLTYMEDSPNYDMQIIQCSLEKGDGMAVIYKMK